MLRLFFVYGENSSMKAFDYDGIAKLYDSLELDDSLNQLLLDGLDRVFRNCNVKSIWDASCGTGAQAIPLCEKGYKIVATDLSRGMLQLAKEKAQAFDITFDVADMRTYQIPRVDAIISLYNALAHLSRNELSQFFSKLSKEMKSGALFIGDFDNRDYLERNEAIISNFFLSGEGEVDGKSYRRLSRAESQADGLYSMKDRWFLEGVCIHEGIWDLQSWRVNELTSLASATGFAVLGVYSRSMDSLAEDFDSFLLILQKL